jgi:putative endonuclease
MAKHNNTGKEGELLAQKHLQSLGYEILHTNWVCNKNELDIVATKDNLLVIVEVKSRSSLRFEQPKDAITNAKIKRIVQATNDYIQQFELD